MAAIQWLLSDSTVRYMAFMGTLSQRAQCAAAQRRASAQFHVCCCHSVRHVAGRACGRQDHQPFCRGRHAHQQRAVSQVGATMTRQQPGKMPELASHSANKLFQSAAFKFWMALPRASSSAVRSVVGVCCSENVTGQYRSSLSAVAVCPAARALTTPTWCGRCTMHASGSTPTALKPAW